MIAEWLSEWFKLILGIWIFYSRNFLNNIDFLIYIPIHYLEKWIIGVLKSSEINSVTNINLPRIFKIFRSQLVSIQSATTNFLTSKYTYDSCISFMQHWLYRVFHLKWVTLFISYPSVISVKMTNNFYYFRLERPTPSDEVF